MEKPNVNNLNGVPNFGHGFELTDTNETSPMEVTETVPTVIEEPSIDEVEEDGETEVKVKKKKK